MKTVTIFILVILLHFSTQGQVTEVEKKNRTMPKIEEDVWKIDNNLSMTLSQVSLTNWASGGNGSVSLNGRFI